MNHIDLRRMLLFPLIIAATIYASVVIGRGMGTGMLSYQYLLAGGVAATLLLFLTLGQSAIPTGLVIWVLMFCMGYRTLHITQVFSLHPLLLFIFLLGLLSFAQNRSLRNLAIGIQPIMFLAAIIWALGWLSGAARGRTWDVMAPEALNFAAVIPVFHVVAYALRRSNQWRPLVAAFFVAGSAIASLGLMEYSLPELGNIALPGFIMASQTYYIGPEGFLRAVFSFWGAPTATFICLLAIPLAYALWGYARRFETRVLILVATIVQLLGIYIGGYRSIWALTGVVFIVMLLNRRSVAAIVLGVLVIVFVTQILPEAAQERVARAWETIQGNLEDHSTQVRYDRAAEALTVAVQNPFGIGWGGTGWTHSDFVQVAGNLGILPGVLFAGWYLKTLFSAWRSQQSHPNDRLMLALLGSYVAAGGLLLVQGVQVLAQLVMPVWLVWAMTHTRIRQLEEASHEMRETLGPYTDVQQPKLSARPPS